MRFQTEHYEPGGREFDPSAAGARQRRRVATAAPKGRGRSPSNLSGRAIFLFKSTDYSVPLGRFFRGCPIELKTSI